MLDVHDVIWIKVNKCMTHVHAVLCAFEKIVRDVSRPISSQVLADTELKYGREHHMSNHAQSDEHMRKHYTKNGVQGDIEGRMELSTTT